MELLTDLHANEPQPGEHSDYDASFSQKTILMKDGVVLSEK
jgi:putative ABC transport system ATP-binding protein